MSAWGDGMGGGGNGAAPAARVLVVDDDPYNRDVLEQELDLLGCQALPAADGREALGRLHAERVDLILLDVMMPGMDGFAVLCRLKTDRALRDIPVIMISARDDLESVVRGIELGAEDYLPKPFDPVLLKARVNAGLEKKRWRDQEAAYRERIEHLLHAILPAPAVAELKLSDRIAPRRYEGVAVMFADIVGFTRYCDTHPPEEVVANLDHLVEACEHLVAAHGLEKIKTIGDGLMATANLLEPNDDPVMASLRCALAMAEAAERGRAGWRLRAGIHVGPVVAGVVGRRKFSFDLWGDTVNVAARLSELGPAGAVCLSGEAWARTGGRCRGRPLGRVPLKGKGEVEVHCCEGLGR